MTIDEMFEMFKMTKIDKFIFCKLIKRIDKNKDWKIDFMEFKSILDIAMKGVKEGERKVIANAFMQN